MDHAANATAAASMINRPPLGDRAAAVCVTTSLFTILTIVFLAMRVIHKHKAPYARYALDDVLLFVAMLLFLAQNAMLLASVKFGYGQHLAKLTLVDPQDVVKAVRLPLYASAVSYFALCFAKLSVGATLLHLCRGVTYLDKRLALTYKTLIITAIVCSILGNLLAIIFTLHGCRLLTSRRISFETPSALATCLQLSTHLVVNLLFVFSTMWLLRKLKLAARDRLAIDLLLCFMFSASIVSIAKAAKLPTTLMSPELDPTWDLPIMSILLSAEIGLSIMAACLPSIRRVFGQHFPSHWRFWHNNRDDGPELVMVGGATLPALSPLGIAAPHAIHAAVDQVNVVTDAEKPEWVIINRLEDGLRPLDESKADDISVKEQKCPSLDQSTDRYSGRMCSERSSSRLSWS